MTEAPPPTSAPVSTRQLLEPTSASGLSTADLARATVQILALVGQGETFETVWTGSGSVVTPDGLILTNAHVVDDRFDEFDQLGIAVTGRSDEPPTLTYLAEIATIDYALDLAVLRVVSDLNGDPIDVSLPFVPLGDSDSIEIGDHLRILGYPGIGGSTITFTEGAVSGFTRERSVQGRAWIKTDATIAGGNSGGMGVNNQGELVGIPTQVTSGAEDGESVDCRPLADTNRDGSIDEFDQCVPVGGFINALRPANLALSLIERADQGAVYAGGSSAPEGEELTLPEAADFFNLRFSNGVTEDDQPTQLWLALPSGSGELCVFWDYEEMRDGLRWAVYWFRDGEYVEEGSLPSEIWSGGAQGNWWACVFNTSGLSEGLYEVTLEVEETILGTESVFVGDHPLVTFEVANQSSRAVCILQISPSEAQNWGPDELDDDEILASNSSRSFSLPTGIYDIRLLDCDANTLAEAYDLDVVTDSPFVLSD